MIATVTLVMLPILSLAMLARQGEGLVFDVPFGVIFWVLLVWRPSRSGRRHASACDTTAVAASEP